MWFEMLFLDLDGGLQEYLFYNNLYYSVPYIKFHNLKKETGVGRLFSCYQLGFVPFKKYEYGKMLIYIKYGCGHTLYVLQVSKI